MKSLPTLTLALALLSAVSTQAAIVTVSGKLAGRFGSPVGGFFPFQTGHVFGQAGESISTSVTGQVGIGGGEFVDPIGATYDRVFFMSGGEGFSPLEEGIIDSGGFVPSTNPDSSISSIGALIAAFVPESRTSDPGFLALDADDVVDNKGIFATELFLVGNGSTFVAPAPGTLFFGINEAFPNNNSGAFTVNITENSGSGGSIPEPATTALFSAAISAAFVWIRRRKLKTC